LEEVVEMNITIIVDGSSSDIQNNKVVHFCLPPPTPKIDVTALSGLKTEGASLESCTASDGLLLRDALEPSIT
jgi:hypothetical protein